MDVPQSWPYTSRFQQGLELASTPDQKYSASLGLASALRLSDRQPEALEVLGITEDAASQLEDSDKLARVHFTRGKGQVFNAGTTEWVAGLARGDHGVCQVTRNVLKRFLA